MKKEVTTQEALTELAAAKIKLESMQQLLACFRVFCCVYDIPLFNLELLAAIGTGKIGDMWF